MQLPKLHLFPVFSDQNPNFTGLFAEISIERVADQNFDETTSCATIFVTFVVKLFCHCFIMLAIWHLKISLLISLSQKIRFYVHCELSRDVKL